MQPQTLLRAEDVADVLRIGRTRTYALIGSGELKSIKVGRSRRITRQALDEYIAKLIAAAEAIDPDVSGEEGECA